MLLSVSENKYWRSLLGISGAPNKREKVWWKLYIKKLRNLGVDEEAFINAEPKSTTFDFVNPCNKYS